MMFHPASLLLVWGCLLVLLQWFPLNLLLPATFMAITMAVIQAKPLYLSMLRRTRWLFLTLMVLFPVMTPGVLVPTPWNFGFITQEGMLAASEHVLRLAAMLGLVVVLLDTLNQRAIVTGLFVLLRPLSAIGIDRERISVRLLLVLDHVAADRHDWRLLLRTPSLPITAADSLGLSDVALRARDAVMAVLAITATVAGWAVW